MDLWMMLVIVVLLFVLIFLSLAEMSMSQMTKPRAAALAEKGVKSGKALVRLAAQPAMWVNPLLLLINVSQTVQATLTGIVANSLFGPAGVAVGVALNVVLFFVLAEAVPKTYALLNPINVWIAHSPYERHCEGQGSCTRPIYWRTGIFGDR
jgi:Mg2+/Co2+ transporter CorB